MIDLHCHVLPGLDDGPLGSDASLAMLRVLEADGVQTVVATPHLRADYPNVVASELADRCRALRAQAAEAGCAIGVAAGGEVDIDWALNAAPGDLRAVSLRGAGTDLLLETPHGRLPAGFEDSVVALTHSGFRVTLAHPELNPVLQRAPERLGGLVRAGVLLQVSARSLLRDDRRSRSAALARHLVRDGLCHVLATDAHSAGPWRAPDLSRGVLAAAQLAGARAEWMVTDAPAAILAGAPLPAAPATAPSPRGLAWLRRRVA